MVTEFDKLNRIRDLKKLLPTVECPEARRAYTIQLDTLLPKTDKILRIDADGLLYMVAFAPSYKKEDAIDDGTFVGKDIIKTRFKDYKLHLKALVDDVVQECKYHSVLGDMIRFSSYELVFTSSTNFRYDIFPEYKKSRINKPQTVVLKRLKKYAKTYMGIVPEGVEADDYVYYYGMKGNPVATGDKDVFNSILGGTYYYKSIHRKVITTTKEEADRWTLLQTLIGDSGDDIPGLIGLGDKTAVKLLGDNPTFDRVIEIYENKNTELEDKRSNTIVKNVFKDKTYTKADAILTRQLVGLDQYNARRGKVRLFTWN